MIYHMRKVVPISFSCRYFGVSRSSYYYWKKDKKLVSLEAKDKVIKAIQTSFDDSKGTYGSPRVYEDLVNWGFTISENTVAKYMSEMGLDARLKKKYRVQTTDSNHSDPIAERLFKAELEDALPQAPGELLAGDITYLKLGDRHVYRKSSLIHVF